jgi:trk system potassium uptake protein TrkA
MIKKFKNKAKAEDYTIIIGCGRLGASIANKLSDEGRSVLIIDKDGDSFKRLAFTYGGLTLNGDAGDFHILAEANADKATSVVLVTDSDNTNILVAQLFKERYKTKNVVVRLDEPERACVYEGYDIKTVSPALLSVAEINKLLAEPNGEK